MIEIRNLTKRYGDFTAVDDISLSVSRGEIYGFLGPNGAGKTTLIDVISGKTRPHSGRVTFDGHDALRLQPHQLARRGMGRKFQTPAIFTSLTVRENLEAAGGLLHGGWRLLLPVRAEINDRVDEVLEITQLTSALRSRAGVLSHGQQQWLEIGMLLMQAPKLMLLDEPVAGLTRAERDRTSRFLQTVQERCAILIVEHDMAFVRQFDATVTVLHQGRVLVEGPMRTVQKDERVIEVYLGRLEEAEVA